RHPRPPLFPYTTLFRSAFSSTFVDASSIPQNTDGTRSGASRLSWPQHTKAPAQYSGRILWYELKLGAVSPQSAGRCASTPAMNRSEEHTSELQSPYDLV